LLIEYNSDAEANAGIGRQLKSSGHSRTRVEPSNSGRAALPPPILSRGRIAGQTLGQFARENWSDQTLVAAILGDVADPSPSVAARIQGVTEGLRQELPNVPPVLLDSSGHPVRAEGVLAKFLALRPGANCSSPRSTTPPPSLPNPR